MLREAVYSIAGFVLLAYAAEWILSLFDDPREPKRLQSKIPLFGHLWGMMKYSSGYHGITSKQTNEEMYTVAIFNTKLYIAKTSRLIPLIQKTSKTLSFRPFMQTAAKLMGDAKPETFEVFGTEWVDSFSHAHKNGLATGPFLDEQNLRMGDRALIDIEQLLPKEISGVSKLNLLEWAQYAVVQTSACGIFGVEHPFLDPKVDRAFWKWQSYLPLHMVNLDITGQGYAARQIVFDAFRKYNKNLPNDVSFIYKERLRSMREAGIDEDDICKQQATFGTAAFANTVPIMYWTIYELFSRPDLLEEVRKEVIEQAVSGDKDSGFEVDVAALKTKCPLTLSVFQETQRLRHVHANIRKVTEDTLLDGKYLLKAGHYVMMPGQPVHTNTSTWGPTADQFDPYRFTKDSSDRKASSFVAWGAPPHLCPARQFASTEILIVVALLAVRSDIAPVKGEWVKNPALNTGDMATVYTPKKSVEVEVRKKEDWDGEWSLRMGESKTRISLASG
ncbi:cytochrome P450 monooxygenase 4F5 [Fusarium pseudocircinatum]|uniref:Cytochrome P450 monooxygenase 4F5 n=1 Tax=Fusarium pseudocircinatum TaxID=56676 RepID=A0A8H5KIY6_9HYPO|nr:cytochrome P450 monooxygenase 4F5 [Fusarium pseudocircinatum]